MSPTPTYTTLLNDIFSYLDPQNTGLLLPETLSRLMDDLGYPINENPWKQGLTSATTNQPSLANADKALKNVFDLCSIEHRALQRPKGDSTPMPAITRKGLVDFFVIDVLCEPSVQWGNISRLLRKYHLPRYVGWGDLPKTVVPAIPDQATLDRVAGIVAFMRDRAEKERGEAQLAENRRQTVVGLVGRITGNVVNNMMQGGS
ncbi:hypothetical protein C0991_000289 [Blastosporella zonata]|nr:hypothetical protein C0991_000289 [Blastosporella zonata]